MAGPEENQLSLPGFCGMLVALRKMIGGKRNE